MRRTSRTLVGLILGWVSLTWPTAHPIDSPAGKPVAVDELIEQLKEAGPERRTPLIHRLCKAGPEALARTRAAREAASDPALKKAFARAARWQLVAKITPVLRAGSESQLTFDGQYTALREEGPEVVDALLSLLGDEASEPGIRLAACHAIADVANANDLPRLREIHNDILLPGGVREQTGILLAIFGDTHTVFKEIQQLEQAATDARPQIVLAANIALANLYYRIRNYEKAVGNYDTILRILEATYETQKELGLRAPLLQEFEKEMALHYYNAACSNALHKDIEKCKALLKKAVRGHAIHYNNIEKDGDLEPLRQDPSYAQFRRELQKLFEGRSL